MTPSPSHCTPASQRKEGPPPGYLELVNRAAVGAAGWMMPIAVGPPAGRPPYVTAGFFSVWTIEDGQDPISRNILHILAHGRTLPQQAGMA